MGGGRGGVASEGSERVPQTHWKGVVKGVRAEPRGLYVTKANKEERSGRNRSQHREGCRCPAVLATKRPEDPLKGHFQVCVGGGSPDLRK